MYKTEIVGNLFYHLSVSRVFGTFVKVSAKNCCHCCWTADVHLQRKAGFTCRCVQGDAKETPPLCGSGVFPDFRSFTNYIIYAIENQPTAKVYMLDILCVICLPLSLFSLSPLSSFPLSSLRPSLFPPLMASPIIATHTSTLHTQICM